jgi:hypothetical protein
MSLLCEDVSQLKKIDGHLSPPVELILLVGCEQLCPEHYYHYELLIYVELDPERVL